MHIMKIINFLTALIVATLAGASFTSCDDNLYKPEAPVSVESLELDETLAGGYEAVIGQSFNIAGMVTVSPVEATDKMESFSSLNPGVATVDETGRVVTRGVGKTVLTITVDGQSAQFLLNVISRISYDVTGIELAQTSYEPDVNQTFDLFSKVHLTPVLAEPLDLTFTSSNASVAEIDEAGQVTGKGQGHAVITIASKYDPNVRTTFTLDVFVPDANFTIDEVGLVTAYSGPGGDVRVPATAKSIAASILRGNTTITTLHLNNVEEVQANAFRECAALTRVHAPNVVTLLGECFNACPQLLEVTGDKIRTMKNAVFQNCVKLESINLENVNEIGQFAFAFTNLERVYMPSLVTIDERRRQFSDCPRLVSVDMPALKTINVDMLFQNCPLLSEVNMPELENLAKVTVNQGSGQQTFENCTALVRIRLPKLKNLRTNTFNGCTALTRIDLSQTTGLDTVDSNFMPTNYSAVTIYVASDAIKALFPADAAYTVVVGNPPA
jgi:hypothetical protein